MTISLPDLSLVVLIGASGSGKSSFARQHFLPTEVVSSDFCRGLVCDDQTSLEATTDAFEILHAIVAKRLHRARLTVIDATNVQPEARKPLLELARQFHVRPVAIVLDVPEKLCHERNASRPDRVFGPHVVRNHVNQLRRSLRGLEREGFRNVHVLRSPEEIEGAQIVRQPLWNDKRNETGPFDIIGDIHGCGDELEALLRALGYAPDADGVWAHLAHRAIFLGDLCDRGPRVVDALDIVRRMTQTGRALCVPGNHDVKLLRWLRGKNVPLTHGLQESVAQIEALPDEHRETWKRDTADWLDALVSHYVLDGGKLVVAHAGMKAEMQGRASGAVRAFALWGETTGETDEWGLPERLDWARGYKGKASVVYGHTPVPRAQWHNNTLNIDTGCVFGGFLTALRWPERDVVSVPAARAYAESIKPLDFAAAPTRDDVLDVADVLGKRVVETRLAGRVTLREENTAAALEVMSRFGADPRWLIYLPPTMSPCATSKLSHLLEHPDEAFSYYRDEGVERVVCEEKHMGSRAVVVVCRDEASARRAFGVEAGAGLIYTRTGRPFFSDEAWQQSLLSRLRQACDAANWWREFESDWFCLDCELMPWSVKAGELLSRQYAPAGVSARASLSETHALLAQGAARGDVAPEDVALLSTWRDDFAQREDRASRYVEAYRRYCWDVPGVDALRLAPFHLLAAEGRTFFDQPHTWHMKTLHRLCEHDDVLLATPFRVVELNSATSCRDAVEWWNELTGSGGEGMVVKPWQWEVQGAKGRWVQPAVKCRGAEYLRLIYGPEYDAPANLERLKNRGLGHKRALALREWALGVEALERFARGDGLRAVHECVFGVLALESEPVDPRL